MNSFVGHRKVGFLLRTKLPKHITNIINRWTQSINNLDARVMKWTKIKYCPESVLELIKTESELGAARNWSGRRVRESDSYSVCDENALKFGSGDGGRTRWVYVKPLDCVLKKGWVELQWAFAHTHKNRGENPYPPFLPPSFPPLLLLLLTSLFLVSLPVFRPTR